jgi:hypothetical protein
MNWNIDINDIITGERLQQLCEITIINNEIYNFHKSLDKNINKLFIDNDNYDYNLLKNSKSIFIYTDLLDVFIVKYLKYLEPSKEYILMTHNSDICIDEKYKYLLDNYNVRLYSQNINIVHTKLYSIPIGIANSQWRHGNLNILLKNIYKAKNVILINRIDKIYVNFDINTNLQYRTDVINSLKKSNISYIGSFTNYENYLNELSKFRWVACPRGNGIDIHRLWETLYIGSLPLVDKNINTEQYKDLPIIYIDDWKNITYDYLMNETNKIIANLDKYNYNKLSLDYWKKLIN